MEQPSGSEPLGTPGTPRHPVCYSPPPAQPPSSGDVPNGRCSARVGGRGEERLRTGREERNGAAPMVPTPGFGWAPSPRQNLTENGPRWGQAGVWDQRGAVLGAATRETGQRGAAEGVPVGVCASGGLRWRRCVVRRLR